MNIITITAERARPGEMSVTIKRAGSKRPYCYTCKGEGEAAAKAAELANSCGGVYQILGNGKVLTAIRTGGIIGDSST